jgi:hypothetical protein
MPMLFLRLLLPLVNGRSTAAATVLLPPAPPGCFYGGAALAMYQPSMRKHCAGLSTMNDALLLDPHDNNAEAQHGHHQPPRHLPRQQQQPHRQHQYRPLVIVLVGPTAVGKANVAALLCLLLWPWNCPSDTTLHGRGRMRWRRRRRKRRRRRRTPGMGQMTNLSIPWRTTARGAMGDAAPLHHGHHRHRHRCSAVRPCGVRRLGPGILRCGRWIEQAYGRQIAVHAPPPHQRRGPPRHCHRCCCQQCRHIVRYDTLFMKQNIPSMIILPAYVGNP